jgi:hypothetical protein
MLPNACRNWPSPPTPKTPPSRLPPPSAPPSTAAAAPPRRQCPNPQGDGRVSALVVVMEKRAARNAALRLEPNDIGQPKVAPAGTNQLCQRQHRRDQHHQRDVRPAHRTRRRSRARAMALPLTSTASSGFVHRLLAKISDGPDASAIPGTRSRMRGPSSTMPASVAPTVSTKAVHVTPAPSVSGLRSEVDGYVSRSRAQAAWATVDPPNPLPQGEGVRGDLVQSVEALGATRHHLADGLGRLVLDQITHHPWCAREEAVGMRIVGRPKHLVRPDIVHQRM